MSRRAADPSLESSQVYPGSLLKRTRIYREVLKWCVLNKSSWRHALFGEKVHSLSVALEPLAIWNKKLEGLESEFFKELKTSPVAAPEHSSKRTQIQNLGIFSVSLSLSDVESAAFRCRVYCVQRLSMLLSGVVVWWWLSVNAF